MNEPLVTVLMAVYNGGEYLKSSVESVLNQTYKDFEFLIVNDKSTDDSVKTIESFRDERIVIHNNDVNLGQTKSLNVGLRLARGKYVARMDADDAAFPLWIETLVRYMENHLEYAVVGSTAIVMNETGKMKKIHRTPTTFEEVIFHIFFGNAINHVGVLINKEIILRHGGYNEKFKITQDYELWSSLIRNNHRIISVPEVLVAVRVHESSQGFVEEKRKGLHEAAEIICSNVNALTHLNISHDDAVKLRMNYRFPEQSSLEEFSNTQELYGKILSSLKDGYRINPRLLRKKLKAQMVIPFCKRAISEIEQNRLKAARGVILSYQKLYGYHVIPFVMFLMSFLGKAITKKLWVFRAYRKELQQLS